VFKGANKNKGKRKGGTVQQIQRVKKKRPRGTEKKGRLLQNVKATRKVGLCVPEGQGGGTRHQRPEKKGLGGIQANTQMYVASVFRGGTRNQKNSEKTENRKKQRPPSF